MRNKANKTDMDNQKTTPLIVVDLDCSDHEISLALREAFKGQSTTALIDGYTRALLAASKRRIDKDSQFKYLWLTLDGMCA